MKVTIGGKLEGYGLGMEPRFMQSCHTNLEPPFGLHAPRASSWLTNIFDRKLHAGLALCDHVLLPFSALLRDVGGLPYFEGEGGQVCRGCAM